MPKLSVIMSVYNGDRYLKNALDSIIHQTFTDFEFIIFEDGSTDNSLEILKKYELSDSRIILIEKEKNVGIKGFIENLNSGLKIANGELIARMDQDDIALPERFQKQILFLQENPDVSVVGAQINLINEKDIVTGEKIAELDHAMIEKKITSKIQLFHPVIMFRNHQNIFYRDKFLYCEDYDLYLNLITQGKKLANIDEKLLNYRVLDKSISRRGDSFVRKLMVEKTLYFYKLRKEIGNDSYDEFNNEEVLNINDISFKNKLEELFFALEAAIKLNNKSELQFLLQKIKKHYSKERIPIKYFAFNLAPIFIFRILKKVI